MRWLKCVVAGDKFYSTNQYRFIKILPCFILFLCFSVLLSIAITSLREERANQCFSYVCSICASLVFSDTSSP